MHIFYFDVQKIKEKLVGKINKDAIRGKQNKDRLGLVTGNTEFRREFELINPEWSLSKKAL